MKRYVLERRIEVFSDFVPYDRNGKMSDKFEYYYYARHMARIGEFVLSVLRGTHEALSSLPRILLLYIEGEGGYSQNYEEANNYNRKMENSKSIV